VALKYSAYSIEWSPEALRSFDTIIHYIEERFSISAAQKFAKRTMSIVVLIAERPELFRKSEKSKNKHIVVVTKQTTLYYRVNHRKKLVQLLLFGGTRQNPASLNY
jgi:plasmid stabilization system protein ParE